MADPHNTTNTAAFYVDTLTNDSSDNMAALYEDNRKITGWPPFPDNVSTVPLLRIDLDKLVAGDQAEIDRLWHASTTIGFFYLDLVSHSDGEIQCMDYPSQEGVVHGKTLLDDAFRQHSLGTAFFELPLEEKLKYDFRSQGSYFGYKAYGAGVVDAQGTRDRNEFYNTSKDFVLGLQDPLPEPELLRHPIAKDLMQDFMLRSHAVVTLLLDVLNDKLGLPKGKLAELHRLRKCSGDQVRWVKTIPQPDGDKGTAMGAHTDFGSITLLFNILGGLQVKLPGSEDWAYVRPLDDHCVVNIGDALVKFSAGILKSNIHRVVEPPGEQQRETRFSVVYFARPEDEVKLCALTGSDMIARQKPDAEEDLNAKDWILRRALNRRVGGDFDKGTGTEGS